MNKRIKVPNLVTIMILTLMTIIFWVGFEVYHALTTKPDPDVPSTILAPLNATIDSKVLDQLHTKINFDSSPILTPTPVSNPG